jgi:hypothetical protein
VAELPFDVWNELQDRGHVERGSNGEPVLTAKGVETFMDMENGDDVAEFTYDGGVAEWR